MVLHGTDQEIGRDKAVVIMQTALMSFGYANSVSAHYSSNITLDVFLFRYTMVNESSSTWRTRAIRE